MVYRSPMARQKFAIGNELDLIGTDEFNRAHAETIRAIIGLRQPPTVEKVSFVFSSDAGGLVGPGSAGNQEVEVWRVPQGMRADVNRITLDIAGWPTAVATAAGRLALRADDTAGPLIYFWPQPGGGNVAPSIESYGGDAPRLGGGQRLVLLGTALVASTEFVLNLQCTLHESPAALRGR